MSHSNHPNYPIYGQPNATARAMMHTDHDIQLEVLITSVTFHEKRRWDENRLASFDADFEWKLKGVHFGPSWPPSLLGPLIEAIRSGLPGVAITADFWNEELPSPIHPSPD